ncbi:unnamed protein product [Candidula unifasciata]|uniref:protein-tyrosine-phosphatase n=1 Tax=Candidula unifasciata TaxID=100452 RepID=A0A8S3ZYL4_9EUPU|nr:unnamed protein product [Candidula unifasciata]
MSSQTETEFAEFDAKNSWNEVFQRLKNESSLASLGEHFSTKVARDPDNRRKNRYRDVSPYDHSRVKLSGESEYINASFIEVPEANRRYILTQGPLEHTMGDFWQMIWEQQSRAVVMLNRVIEKGTLKCSQYWPLGAGYGYEQEMYFPECGLMVTLVAEKEFQHFTLRSLELEKLESGEKRELLHFHYTTWPDFGVPSSPHAFLHFLHSVRGSGSLGADIAPAVIHCSAGIGRSGTFCLVDSCLVMVENSGTLKEIDVRKLLIKMRTYRMGLVQTADQLRFSYQAIVEGAHAILSEHGLEDIQLPTLSWNQNHADSQPSHTTDKAVRIDQNGLSLLQTLEEPPPPLPPKKGPVSAHAGMNGWGEEEDEESEDEEMLINERVTDDENDGYNDDDEFDQLVDRSESDSLDGSDDSDKEIRITNTLHQIRQERKKQTAEQILKMKERQQKSERLRAAKSHTHNSMYIGLAVVIGAAAVIIYKYFL